MLPVPALTLATHLPCPLCAPPRQVMRAVLLAFILSAQCVAMTSAINCYTNSATSLHLCDRWIACRQSNGMLCDDGTGTLGTSL